MNNHFNIEKTFQIIYIENKLLLFLQIKIHGKDTL